MAFVCVERHLIYYKSNVTTGAPFSKHGGYSPLPASYASIVINCQRVCHKFSRVLRWPLRTRFYCHYMGLKVIMCNNSLCVEKILENLRMRPSPKSM